MKTNDPNQLKWHERVKAPTPAFFKKLRTYAKLALGIATLAASGQMEINGQSIAVNFPPAVDSLIEYTMIISTLVILVTSLAVDPDALLKKQNEKSGVKSTIN